MSAQPRCDICGVFITRDAAESIGICPSCETDDKAIRDMHVAVMAEQDAIEASRSEGDLYVTKTGKILTDQEIEDLAEEAMEGYDFANAPPCLVGDAEHDWAEGVTTGGRRALACTVCGSKLRK